MSDATGYRVQVGKIVVTGDPLVKQLKNVETVTNVYPGRLVAKGTTDFDIKVADGVHAVPEGWAGYEDCAPEFKPATIDTIFVASDKIRVLRGGNFVIRATMPRYFYCTQGDPMVSWQAGQVVPAVLFNGQPFVKIPFTKANGNTDTNIDLAQYQCVSDVRIMVTTGIASGYVDFGIGIGAEAGFDYDGFADNFAAVTSGTVTFPTVTLTTGTNANYLAAVTDATIGALLAQKFVGINVSEHDKGWVIPRSYSCDGTCKSLCYDTGNYACAGYICMCMENAGVIVVGYAEETVDGAAAAVSVMVRSTL